MTGIFFVGTLLQSGAARAACEPMAIRAPSTNSELNFWFIFISVSYATGAFAPAGLYKIKVAPGSVNVVLRVVDVELAGRGDHLRIGDHLLDLQRCVIIDDDGGLVGLATPQRDPDFLAVSEYSGCTARLVALVCGRPESLATLMMALPAWRGRPCPRRRRIRPGSCPGSAASRPTGAWTSDAS